MGMKPRWRLHRVKRRLFGRPYDSVDLFDFVCNREWHAEGIGLLACDLTARHEGDHVSFYEGRHTAPNLDAIDPIGDKDEQQ